MKRKLRCVFAAPTLSLCCTSNACNSSGIHEPTIEYERNASTPSPTLPRCGRCASCEGGGRTAEDWMAVGVSRYRYLRNPQHLFPRKDSLPRGGGAGLPLKKANAFFKGTRGGGSKPTSAASLNTHAKHSKKPKYTNQPSDMKEMPSTPSPALLRAPRKMQSHFAWEPARCGLRPARERAVRRELQTFMPASAT